MRAKLLLLIGLSTVLYQCKTETDKVLVPRQANEFVWVYKPAGDYFFGPDTEYLNEGEWYDEWVANDHTFVKGEDGLWHIFGITHPLVESDPLQKGIHDGEYASFHAVSSASNFSGTLEEDHYSDLSKVLPPKDRPGEILANHAPYIVKKDGVYHMVYGHSPIRLARSTDLMKWETKGDLFREAEGDREEEQLFNDARDPNLLFHDGKYYIVYCSSRSVNLRESEDLIHWSEPRTIFKTDTFDPESPSLIFHNNTFYLFVCSWNGIWDQKEIVGAYQHLTYVLQSDDPLNFGVDGEKQITTLNSHAPEIFQDEEGNWYISSVEWPNRGVSVDRLRWEEASKLTENPDSYIASVEEWQEERLEGLKDEEGWLNLAGIYWLKEGVQSFGSDPSNDIVFPAKAPAFMGTLSLEDTQVHITVNDDVELFYKGKAVGELELTYDSNGDPTYITHGDFAWYIMKRHKSLAIRLRDYKNPAIEALDHIPSYPIDPDYLVEAKLKPFAEAKTITVPMPFQDYTQDYKCPGELHFKLKGKKMTLLPFTSGEKYFIIIYDETSGLETYGGGRFMYASEDSSGRILLDFNKAYNPPCALTEFAACPMPPSENRLPVSIEAGEKILSVH